ncbi:hypothetical protein [Mycobacterium sp. URHB0021]|jgi:hypothetical protein
MTAVEFNAMSHLGSVPHAQSEQELVVRYRRPDNGFGAMCWLVVAAAGSLLLVLLGLKAWGAVGCWALGVYPIPIGIMGTWMSLRGVLKLAVVMRRGARRDWWLRLSTAGFEINDRLRKPHREQWRGIAEFTLAESVETFDDGSSAVTKRVGFRYVPECRRRREDGRWISGWRSRDRDGRPDGFVMGHWDRPLDEAVSLMNVWRARYTAPREFPPIEAQRRRSHPRSRSASPCLNLTDGRIEVDCPAVEPYSDFEKL